MNTDPKVSGGHIKKNKQYLPKDFLLGTSKKVREKSLATREFCLARKVGTLVAYKLGLERLIMSLQHFHASEKCLQLPTVNV